MHVPVVEPIFMQQELLVQISHKIKDSRKNRGITMQQLAAKAGVSKALISQIENNRTVPSLTVLLNIIRSLDLDLNDFFGDLPLHNKEEKVILRRAKDYRQQKEKDSGFLYKHILTPEIHGFPVDIILLELEKGASRGRLLNAEAYVYAYVVKGAAEYRVGKKTYLLEEGDSLFFDGRAGYKPVNTGSSRTTVLTLYFFTRPQ
jgi:transcriptional regulator with XRE-family HTH domain